MVQFFGPPCAHPVFIMLEHFNTFLSRDANHFVIWAWLAWSYVWPRSLILWSNKYECTMDQELADAAVYVGADAILFCVIWCHRHLESVMSNENWTLSIDEEQPCTTYQPDPIWNDVALGLFEDGHPKKNTKKKNNNSKKNTKISSDKRLVTRPKIALSVTNATRVISTDFDLSIMYWRLCSKSITHVSP